MAGAGSRKLSEAGKGNGAKVRVVDCEEGGDKGATKGELDDDRGKHEEGDVSGKGRDDTKTG